MPRRRTSTQQRSPEPDYDVPVGKTVLTMYEYLNPMARRMEIYSLILFLFMIAVLIFLVRGESDIRPYVDKSKKIDIEAVRWTQLFSILTRVLTGTIVLFSFTSSLSLAIRMTMGTTGSYKSNNGYGMSRTLLNVVTSTMFMGFAIYASMAAVIYLLIHKQNLVFAIVADRIINEYGDWFFNYWYNPGGAVQGPAENPKPTSDNDFYDDWAGGGRKKP